jgi:hypothetical protein
MFSTLLGSQFKLPFLGVVDDYCGVFISLAGR